ELPPGRGVQGSARRARVAEGGCLHVRRCPPALVREGQARVRRLAGPQGRRRGAGALPVDHGHEAHLLQEPGRPAGRPGHAHAWPLRARARRPDRARRHRRRRVPRRGSGVARRLRRGGGHRAPPGDAGDAGDHARPRLEPRDRSRRQGGASHACAIVPHRIRRLPGRFFMTRSALSVLVAAAVLLIGVPSTSRAATEIQFWHAMTAVLGERVNDIANKFNASQSEYVVKAVHKGSYPETLNAAIAAYRAKEPPHIVQVFEVGTQTMLSSGAVYPVYQLMKDNGVAIDWNDLISPVKGYYSSTGGN